MLPLDVSPVATFLVGLAERRPSGTVSLVSRALQLVSGEIAGIAAAPGDPSFAEFLVQSERLSAATVNELQASPQGFEAALLNSGKLSKAELKSMLRACWLDRFVRELRAARGQPKLLPTLDATQRVTLQGAHPTPLLSFVLDAWTRLAADADAAAVGMRIDFRLVWVPGPLLAEAQRWVSLPDLQERPVVSAVLGRVPAAAAEIAALVRAGFVRLTAPGAQPQKPRSRKDTLPPPPPRMITLSDLPNLPPPASAPPPLMLGTSSAPPPPPAALASLRPSVPPGGSVRPSARSSQTMPSIPPAPGLPAFALRPSTRTSQNFPAVSSMAPSARSSQSLPAVGSTAPSARTAPGMPAVISPSPLPASPQPSGRPAAPPPAPASLRPLVRPSPRPQAAVARVPRLQLQPGGAGGEIEAIPEVRLPTWPAAGEPLHDPLREIELTIAQLEEHNAPGPERARAFIQLAALWQSRIGSLEHATRALREAAAADPENTQVLLQTARQCGALGQLSYALAYARAVAYTAGTAAERAAGHRALADLHAAQGETDACLEALAEAAAEDPENPEPHELLAQLHYERGHVSLAIAHAQRAAAGFTGRTAKRALGWHAVAYTWDPSDAGLAEHYRTALDAAGLIDAAVAISAETARNARDPELRRKLRIETAHFARARGRADLAADLLLESFDDDPSSTELYAQLDSDFWRLGLYFEHCALIESMLRECPVEDKARGWARYAEVLGELSDSTNAERALWFAQRYTEEPEAAPFEVAGFIEQLEAQLGQLEGGPDEPAALNELCGWHLIGGDLRRAVSCALRVAALQPEAALAAARFWRATALRKDGVLAVEALTWLARTQSGAPQVRSLCVLAREHEAQGDFDAALACAEAALAA
ncbi:MAG TPA: tetratricopeptide repeat protein, partial [Polyangiales bacterium]|nr:tetratricopeptide repeat protein [Polyangiales bacterium]